MCSTAFNQTKLTRQQGAELPSTQRIQVHCDQIIPVVFGCSIRKVVMYSVGEGENGFGIINDQILEFRYCSTLFNNRCASETSQIVNDWSFVDFISEGYPYRMLVSSMPGKGWAQITFR